MPQFKEFESFAVKKVREIAEHEDFSQIPLNRKQKETHLKYLVSSLNAQSGGCVYEGIRVVRKISNQDKILVFDLANFFAQETKRDHNHLEITKRKFTEFQAEELVKTEYSESIYNLTLGDEEAIKYFLKTYETYDKESLVENEKLGEYRDYFKRSSQKMMEQITIFITNCEDLKEALQSYYLESKQLISELADGKRLGFIDMAKANSIIVNAMSPSSNLQAGSSRQMALRVNER